MPGVALDDTLSDAIRYGTILQQEIHALAFCSENIKQLDFTNCLSEIPGHTRAVGQASVESQLLSPILNLLQIKLTKCNRLLLGGNPLGTADLKDLRK